MSREHAEIQIDPVSGAVLLDLSMNGTRVNDRVVSRGESVALNDGDVIGVASLGLVFKARARPELASGGARSTLRTLGARWGRAGLLERERELAVIIELVRSAQEGDGQAIILRGPSGIGKTSLLARAELCGRDAGSLVLVARGAELERELAYAVVRRLFAVALGGLQESERHAIFEGAAGLAAPAVAPGGERGLGGDRSFAVLHGLYWLAVNLAERSPLLVLVDDAQWCDGPSLRFLSYLVRRLEGLRVGVVLSVRAGEPGAEAGPLRQLASEEAVRVVEPATLSTVAVRLLVKAALGEPDEEFVLACQRASTGNPYLLAELINALVRDKVAPSATASTRVSNLGPKAVARSVLLRLARLPSAALDLAQAAAVLGDGAGLRHAAAVTELDAGSASAAFDALVAIDLLQRDLPLEFVHPIVRASIYNDMASGRRSRTHARAARVLAADGADPERVAAHLLATEPAAEHDVVLSLRASARAAQQRGAPRAAITYLRRATAEPPVEADRPAVLHELGRAEALVRDPCAVAHLEQALRLAEGPVLRGRIASDLVEQFGFAGRWDAAVGLVTVALAEDEDRDLELTARLETWRAAAAIEDPNFAAELDSRLPGLRALAGRGGRAGRGLALVLALACALRCTNHTRVFALVESGLDGGHLLEEEGVETFIVPTAVLALVLVDELDGAQALARTLLEEARRRGSLAGVLAGLANRALVHAQRGALAAAEADLRAALALAEDHDMGLAVPSTLRYGLDPIVERPQLDDVAGLAETVELESGLSRTASGARLLEVRANARLVRGDAAGAVKDLRRCGEIWEALRARTPILAAWRSTLALALPSSAREEAERLVADELELARAVGLPRALGVALRAAGLLKGGDDGIELLHQAVATLERCPSRLEHARALSALGGALRRAGMRRDAREQLSRGLDLARRCGAERLATRASQELRAAGAKPRRLAFSGSEALTASERRVAELAAGRMSNKQIAESLFVTAKTVENHLGRAYLKLGINSREQLTEALTQS